MAKAAPSAEFKANLGAVTALEFWRLVTLHPVEIGGLVVGLNELLKPQAEAAALRSMNPATFNRHWKAALKFMGVPEGNFTWFSRHAELDFPWHYQQPNRRLVVMAPNRLFYHETVSITTRTSGAGSTSASGTIPSEADDDMTVDMSDYPSPPASKRSSGPGDKYD